ncbi:hypothetical protein [Magnetospirillum fulvum]|uniref:SAM-dependent methyltransferase n=1 Tax=Magnetospirillum fulvum TaxID=1082 RepID=A0A1H6IM79_MAGFU|nr:hypothetical protein [Magnetospirillum fulvum]SEH48557.1 hypothetical protein SAMN04244559_02556 [Magnetospirillum fulvum]
MEESGDHGILWTQFILAAALARSALAARDLDPAAEEVAFSFADTHAGCGCVPPPAGLGRVVDRRADFAARTFHDAVAAPLAGCEGHPGSWVLAGRVLRQVGVAVEIDVNDIDTAQIARAQANREGGWVRFWSHDWFRFLRSRVAMPRRPDFVFIDPPPDDPRGPGYAIDAAILLETLAIPYMITYPAQGAQSAIDQIGRLGLELVRDGHGPSGRGQGAVLGGGAETVVLDVLGDLGRLAPLLGGRFAPRLPRPPAADDYCI